MTAITREQIAVAFFYLIKSAAMVTASNRLFI